MRALLAAAHSLQAWQPAATLLLNCSNAGWLASVRCCINAVHACIAGTRWWRAMARTWGWVPASSRRCWRPRCRTSWRRSQRPCARSSSWTGAGSELAGRNRLLAGMHNHHCTPCCSCVQCHVLDLHRYHADLASRDGQLRKLQDKWFAQERSHGPGAVTPEQRDMASAAAWFGDLGWDVASGVARHNARAAAIYCSTLACVL